MESEKDILMKWPLWREAYTLQMQVVRSFHTAAESILKDACPLRPFSEDLLKMERNLFSIFFQVCTEPLALTPGQKLFYARVSQCLRALVTGCDNLLDDEFKEVIPFALTGSGSRFRSVMTIMTADRIISNLAAAELAAGNLSLAQVEKLSRIVMTVLTPSGLEEHEEESLDKVIIPTPEQIVKKVHHLKTGLLFRATLDLVAGLETGHNEISAKVAEGLRRLGIACQMLDDLKDVSDDLATKHFNAVVSFARYGVDAEEKAAVRLIEDCRGVDAAAADAIVEKIPKAHKACREQAEHFFMEAYEILSSSLPGFDFAKAQAFFKLVTNSIMKNRNLDSKPHPESD